MSIDLKMIIVACMASGGFIGNLVMGNHWAFWLIELIGFFCVGYMWADWRKKTKMRGVR